MIRRLPTLSLGLFSLLLLADRTRADIPPRAEREAALRAQVQFPYAATEPELDLTLGLGYSELHSFGIRSQYPHNEREIARLTHTLRRTPRNVDLALRLADLHAESGHEAEARKLYVRAETLVWCQIKRRTVNPAMRSNLSHAFAGQRRWVEAGAALSPGRCLGPLPPSPILGRIRFLEFQLGSIPANNTEHRPAAANLLNMVRLMYDEAVRKEPNSAIWYARRGNFRAGLERRWNRLLTGTQPTSEMWPEEALRDWERAAQLAPRDSFARALVGWNRFGQAAARRGLQGDTGSNWRALSPEERRPMEAAIARLEILARTRRRREAAHAATALGFLQFETFEPDRMARGKANLRRAFRLDPEREDAAAMLAHAYGGEGEWPEPASWCEEWARVREGVRPRLIGALAYWNLGRWTKAETILRPALAASPDSPGVRLALAAALLKQEGRMPVLRAHALLIGLGSACRVTSEAELARRKLLGIAQALRGGGEAAVLATDGR